MFGNNPLVKGILIGVGASVVGFCMYKHNEEKVDNFLRRHGVKVKSPAAGFETMSVEDLMRERWSVSLLCFFGLPLKTRMFMGAP